MMPDLPSTNIGNVCTHQEVGKIVMVVTSKFYPWRMLKLYGTFSIDTDIGGLPNDYLVVKTEEWKEDFEAWLKTPNRETPILLCQTTNHRMMTTIVIG
jgi:hypothetical protein